MNVNMNAIFAYSNQFTNVEFLKQYPNLKIIHLANNKIQHLPDLSVFPLLEQMHVNQNQISELKGVETLTKLTHLYAWQNKLNVSFSFHPESPIKIIYVNDNLLISLPNLSGLSKLREVSISNNYLTFEDIEPLFLIDSIQGRLYYTPMLKQNNGYKMNVLQNDNIAISSKIEIGNPNLNYKLYRNDTLIDQNTSGTFQLNKLNYKHADVFKIISSSSNVSGLSLTEIGWEINLLKCSDLTQPEFSIIDNTCKNGLTLELKPKNGEIVENLTYTLQSVDLNLSYDFNPNKVVSNVQAGNYVLKTVENANCNLSYPEVFSKMDDCDNIFSPNGDGIKDYYNFETSGEVQIYDVFGNLVLTLETPKLWDGKDSTGNILSSGYYSIIFNKKTLSHLTIISE